jgi:sugar phosphate isomerase/epimerase
MVVRMNAVVRVPRAKVALSTASCYPESCTTAFEMAADLGFDGVEVMVWTDPVSQDPEALRGLSDRLGVPILAIHAPCLLLTQRVWSTDPWAKLVRAQQAAETVGASTVVVHPPFLWQREYARGFAEGLARMQDETDIVFAVENMFPWRARGREIAAYLPHWDPLELGYPAVTLDLSHTAVSGTDAVASLDALGDRLAHVHLADGLGSNKDEHLVPGRGAQPAQALLEHVAASDYDGEIVIEINTRKSVDQQAREADLLESLAFARLHASR